MGSSLKVLAVMHHVRTGCDPSCEDTRNRPESEIFWNMRQRDTSFRQPDPRTLFCTLTRHSSRTWRVLLETRLYVSELTKELLLCWDKRKVHGPQGDHHSPRHGVFSQDFPRHTLIQQSTWNCMPSFQLPFILQTLHILFCIDYYVCFPILTHHFVFIKLPLRSFFT